MLPEHLLYPLVASRRTTTTSQTDGSASSTWATVQITGRLTRGQASESTADGRQTAVSGMKLLTNYAGLATGDRIADPGDTAGPWELDGHPVTVRDADGIHHYEAPVRRVLG